MYIFNKENYITNDQIIKFIDLLGENYRPRCIMIFENRIQYVGYSVRNLFKKNDFNLSIYDCLRGNTESIYNPFLDKIKLYIFAQNGNKQIKQLVTLYQLVKDLRRRHYYSDDIKKKNILLNTEYAFQIGEIAYTMEMLQDDGYECMITNFAKEFMSNNSKVISRIMEWNHEWIIEECEI